MRPGPKPGRIVLQSTIYYLSAGTRPRLQATAASYSSVVAGAADVL